MDHPQILERASLPRLVILGPYIGSVRVIDKAQTVIRRWRVLTASVLL